MQALPSSSAAPAKGVLGLIGQGVESVLKKGKVRVASPSPPPARIPGSNPRPPHNCPPIPSHPPCRMPGLGSPPPFSLLPLSHTLPCPALPCSHPPSLHTPHAAPLAPPPLPLGTRLPILQQPQQPYTLISLHHCCPHTHPPPSGRRALGLRPPCALPRLPVVGPPAHLPAARPPHLSHAALPGVQHSPTLPPALPRTHPTSLTHKYARHTHPSRHLPIHQSTLAYSSVSIHPSKPPSTHTHIDLNLKHTNTDVHLYFSLSTFALFCGICLSLSPDSPYPPPFQIPFPHSRCPLLPRFLPSPSSDPSHLSLMSGIATSPRPLHPPANSPTPSDHLDPQAARGSE